MKQFIAIKEKRAPLQAIAKLARVASRIPGEWKILLAVLLIMGLRLVPIIVLVLKQF